ncbi:hypothetical protein DFQ28_000740 [Apophysomyces sp. BC1034]|nr:hypothetical protein DFQ30_001228 [Apophysomyces sp. BC1015]KAG0167369.1 hypothetical protein DFQ29_000438 [Apophysomyces sp. BC1021]KAG0183850.1 hypothetical protein DFQ28_000740 [Apophysomyces sp. BC1034]
MLPQDWDTLKEEVHAKCIAYDYIDPNDRTLSEFIINLVQVGKLQDQLNEELQELVGSDYDRNLTEWIFTRIKELESPAPMEAEPEPKPQHGLSEPMDIAPKTARPERKNRIFAQALEGVAKNAESPPASLSRPSSPPPRRRMDRSRSRSPERRRERPSYRNREPAPAAESANDNVFSRLGNASRLQSGQEERTSVFNRLGSTKPRTVGDTTMPERCKYWPSCKNGEACTYFHPKTVCPDFPHCPKPARECMFIHPETPKKAAPEPAAPAPVAVAFAKSPIPCRFFPFCSNPMCPFLHPTQPMHVQTRRLAVPCNNGDQCTRPGCHFMHPKDASALSETPCKFDGACTRPGCFYKHTVPPGTVHQNKTLIVKDQPSMSGRQFSVPDQDVERIVVGESADIIRSNNNGAVDISLSAQQEAKDVDKDVVMDL